MVCREAVWPDVHKEAWKSLSTFTAELSGELDKLHLGCSVLMCPNTGYFTCNCIAAAVGFTHLACFSPALLQCHHNNATSSHRLQTPHLAWSPASQLEKWT